MFRTRRNNGQAIAEFAIAFPFLLLLVLGIIQISLMFAARAVVEYAAFSAARAELVNVDNEGRRRDPESAEHAAQFICSAIAGPTTTGGGRQINVPGWGALPRGLASSEKTSVDVLNPIVDDNGVRDGIVEVEVIHLYELVVPVASLIFKPISKPLAPGQVPDDIFVLYGGSPHMVMKATFTRPVPWDMELHNEQSHQVIPEL